MIDFLKRWKHHIGLHIIIFIWGFTGILGKLITLDALSIVVNRMLIAFIALLIWIIYRKRKVIPPTKSLLKMLGIGALVALHWISFFGSIKLSNVSVCLATISITPLFSAFLEPLFYRKKIVLHEVVLGLLVIVGLSTIFSFETEYVLGMSLAVLAAFLAALFTVLNGLMIRMHRATVISTWEMLGGAVTAAVFILISRGEIASAFVFEGWDALYLAVLAVVCTAVAFVVSVEVMKVISPFTVNISISMEPVYSILLALWIFGEEERMSGGFYIGATIILLSVIGNAYWKHRIRKKEEKLASE